jgi:hypothetical protein
LRRSSPLRRSFVIFFGRAEEMRTEATAWWRGIGCACQRGLAGWYNKSSVDEPSAPDAVALVEQSGGHEAMERIRHSGSPVGA